MNNKPIYVTFGDKKIKNFFHKIGLYSTPEERKQIALQRERQRQEKLRKVVESKGQKEPGKQKAEEKSKKRQIEFEELENAIRNLSLFKQIESGKTEEIKKPNFIERFFKREKTEIKTEEKKVKAEERKKEELKNKKIEKPKR